MCSVTSCGTGEPVSAELELPNARRTELTLTPAIDLTDVPEDFAERIVIEEIKIGLFEARLLGAHPSLPPGGLRLLDQPRVVSAVPRGGPAWVTPIPRRYIDDAALAVYLRIDQHEVLTNASVVVHGRLYERSIKSSQALTATDPDGDPAHGGTDLATDPDGDPAREKSNPVVATDPDGDPAVGRARSELAPLVNASVSFELIDQRAEDLVATLQDGNDFDIVIGIPVRQWFNPEVITRLKRAIDLRAAENFRPTDTETRIVVHARPSRINAPEEHTPRSSGGFFLSDDLDADRLTVER